MGDYVAKDNEGVLFRNEKKEKPTHPDYNGNCVVDGVTYWLSAWVNSRKTDGSKYLRVKLKPKDDAPARSYQRDPEPVMTTAAGADDDLPF